MHYLANMQLTSFLLAGALCASTALAHIEMTHPYAIGSKYDPEVKEEEKDYSNTSPLELDGMEPITFF